MDHLGSHSGHRFNEVDHNTDQDEESRNQRLLALQLEALGSTRRHAITTQGHKEDIKLETSSLSAVHRARRVNKVGTTESRITDDVKNGLTSWSTAWKSLENDGAAENTLDAMKDGQTHREKLMSDPSVRDYVEGSEDVVGAFRGRSGIYEKHRGGGRGGRGGGQAGNRPGRHGPARIPTGLTELLSPLPSSKGSHDPPRKLMSNGTAGRSSRKASGQVAAPGSRKCSLLIPDSHQARTENKLAPTTIPTTDRPKTRSSDGEASHPVKTTRNVPRESVKNPAYLAPPDAFMAAAKSMLKVSPAQKPKTVLPPSIRLSSKESPASQAFKKDISTGVTNPEKKDLASTDEHKLKSPPVKADDHSRPFQVKEGVHSQAERTTDLNSTKDAGQEPSRLIKSPPGLAQLLLEHRGTMPPELFAQLQGYLATQPNPSNDWHADATPASITPETVVKVTEPNTASGASTTDLPPFREAPSTQVKAPSPKLTVGHKDLPVLTTSKATICNDASVSEKPAGIEAVPDQAQTPAPPRVQQTMCIVPGQFNIFGEHVIKDRYSTQTSSTTSPMTSKADPLSPLSAGFSRLSLREKDHPGVRLGVPAPSTDAKATAPDFTPAASIKDTQQRLVQAQFTARETPKVVDSAVARQYAAQSVSNLPQYASTNPFAQPLAKEKAKASSRTMSTENPLGVPLAVDRSRASSQVTSTELPAFLRQPSPPTQRFPTTPYNWNQAPKRAPSGGSSKLQLPAFLQGIQPNKDTAAAARAQYGGTMANINAPQRDSSENGNHEARPAARTATRKTPSTTSSQPVLGSQGASSTSQAKKENQPPAKVKDATFYESVEALRKWQRTRESR